MAQLYQYRWASFIKLHKLGADSVMSVNQYTVHELNTKDRFLTSASIDQKMNGEIINDPESNPEVMSIIEAEYVDKYKIELERQK